MDSDPTTSSQSDRVVQPLGYRAPSDEVLEQPTPTWGWSILWRLIVYGGILILFISMIVPVLGRRKSFPHEQTDCAARVRQLITQLALHAQSNGRKYAPTLQAAQGTLLKSQFSKLTSCPEGGTYRFPAAGLSLDLPRNAIVVYEKPASHTDRSGHKVSVFAYADGSVAFIPAAQAQKIITELNAGHNPPRAEKIR